ncbi:MAG TPA: chemotaxis protein CheD [Fimbriimonadaceae bacterium]|nr:chemotaxis protein CheD [Fimbriimonadaceae bacterium]
MRLAQATVVNLASLHVVKGTGRLLCPGLGSCLAVCALDPVTNVAGVAHLMLPKAPDNVSETLAPKFVDSGLETLLVKLAELGANRANLLFAATGGSQLFSFGVQNQSDLGLRNAEAFRNFAKTHELTVVAADLGGTSGRSLSFTIDSGEVLIRTLAQGEMTLCNFRSRNEK